MAPQETDFGWEILIGNLECSEVACFLDERLFAPFQRYFVITVPKLIVKYRRITRGLIGLASLVKRPKLLGSDTKPAYIRLCEKWHRAKRICGLRGSDRFFHLYQELIGSVLDKPKQKYTKKCSIYERKDSICFGGWG